MAIIKSYNATTLLKDAIVLDLGDVTRQARRLRQAAEAKARGIVEDAQNQAEALRQTAHTESAKEGYQEGFEKGSHEGRRQGLEEGHQEAMEAAKDQLEQIQAAWCEAIEQWEAQRQEIERAARGAVVEFAVRFAQKVVHRVVEVDRDVIVDQLTPVLSCVLRPVDITVGICGEDRPILEEAVPRLLSEFSNVKHMHLVDDETISRGGCVISYGQGRIDATIETQLERLAELIV